MLALNDASVHFLAPLDQRKLEAILALTTWARAVELEGVVVAVAWAIPPAQPYWSPFYGWFGERAADFDHRFLYLDRIVVGESARRRGVGTLLYDDVENHAREHDHRWVTCEVDLVPRNDASLAFHRGRDYQPIGELDTRPEGPLVQLFAKPLA